MTVVIAHVFNESYMMQWWLPHHVAIADHGIIIDYASTDDTVALCKEYAPDWEVRQSRNEYFRASDCDAEVMDIERGVDGWKIALTATEFLSGDVTALTERLAIQGHAAAALRPVAMVDKKFRAIVEVKSDIPLDEQCPTGYMGGWITPYKSRIIHCHPDGAYSVGRHSTSHSNVSWHPDGVLLKWHGFAPWTQAMKDRKLQIQTRMPADDIRNGLGFQHVADAAKLDLMWGSEIALSGPLKDIPDYF